MKKTIILSALVLMGIMTISQIVPKIPVLPKSFFTEEKLSKEPPPPPPVPPVPPVPPAPPSIGIQKVFSSAVITPPLPPPPPKMDKQ